MTPTAPIADMLTRIRNANLARLDHVDVPASKMKISLARILKEEGFVKYYKTMKSQKKGLIRIFMKYGPNKEAVINGLDRVSKPGIRRYVGVEEIPRVRGGLGVAILSTSKGVMTGQECRRQRVGGELLCVVW